MAVLVTGATGFVGAWLTRRLSESGETVHVLHRTNSSLEELDGVAFVSKIGDVTDPESVRSACLDVDTVFHLAGVVGYSKAMRAQMERVNVDGTRNVVDAIQTGRKPKLVYMSSVVAVGASFDGRPLDENSTYNVRHLDLGYFETKRKAEELVVQACRQDKIDAVILNPSTIYGAADAKKGSRKTQLKVARGEFPFYTGGGVSVVSVHDVVEAVINARTKGRRGERYILSGENITIHNLFTRIASLAGAEPPKIYLPDLVVRAIGKSGDLLEALGKKGPLNTENAWTAILFHWFDNAKARAELGFRPRPAQDALKESVDWMRQKGLLK
ncbi:MAG TPA: NAD-dependent epimerase/dehydratase family protein [Bdellovibrionales bacterium]|nr:NAD-dependent epimerase/dehydratase family protein [Bdellovibrionales bacterium]